MDGSRSEPVAPAAIPPVAHLPHTNVPHESHHTLMLVQRLAAALVGLSSLLLLLLPAPRPNAGKPAVHSPSRASKGAVKLPATLHLQWVREFPAPRPAWPDQPMMPFDVACKPVVLGRMVFVPSSRTDSVTALDIESGAEKWQFRTDGPVRFAPAVWKDCLFLVSDDGYLYCVDAERGSLRWKFRGGPSDRKILGNERLISMWPARGAPVVAGGTVYFAAGIWPFMGIFLHALDARTGKVVWTNSGDGSIYIKQPHQADAFGGVAPQGRLVVVGDKLLVPGGRSIPACYDRKTGRLLHYRLADNSKLGGGSEVVARGNVFLSGGGAFSVPTGDYLGPVGKHAILTRNVLYSYSGRECQTHDLKNLTFKVVEALDRKGKKVSRGSWKPRPLGAAPLAQVEALVQAGPRLFAATPSQVCALDLPLRGEQTKVSWRAPIDGWPAELVVAGSRLFVATREGRLYCFGGAEVEPRTYALPAPPAFPPADAWTEKAATILSTTGVRAGYGVAFGVGSGRLITELARQSQLRLIVLEPDAEKVRALRTDLASAGFYGERVTVLTGDPETVRLPPYLASLMVTEDLDGAGIPLSVSFVRQAFAALRPYGGVACLPIPAERRQQLGALLAEDSSLAQAKLREGPEWVLLTRAGPLPGAANWTHEHADAANTRVSKDALVKAPLGVLWFGGPSHNGILPRHGHGPQPQVIDGRCIIEGVDMLRAIDIYTGRLLWETHLPGVGAAYDNTAHQVGANAGGTNYISMPDGIYVAHGAVCLRLDPATGHQLSEFRLPAFPGATGPVTWGYLNVTDQYLVGGANVLAGQPKGRSAAVSSSEHLVVMDRHSGAVLWTATARAGFRHNAICLGGGRLYVMDRPSLDHLLRLKRQGKTSTVKPRLLAFDLATGKERWRSDQDLFGTWLSYAAKHDVLIEAGRNARDTLWDEPTGMRAWRAGSGQVLWYQKQYVGPAMIHGDVILKDKSACYVLTGAPVLRTDPLTGQQVPWTWTRGYGCNTPAASEHLLTFRSGAAGYFDLCHDGGTGNFGGFRSGCTNNLIVAGGLLNVPDYTRSCTCSYQNQTSLALVPMPEAEMWTFFTPQTVSGPIRRVGIALGAPGNRKAADGTLWLEYPHVGGPSAVVPVRVMPGRVEWFRRHASQVAGGLPWVAASGVKGVQSVQLTLSKERGKERTYTVRLHFAEPDPLGPGERVFHVALQRRDVLRNFDIVRAAGGPNRAVVKEFRGIRAGTELTVTLRPAASARVRAPILCGIEVVAEGW
jgi:outer membrane protein assembly factor BamB